MLVFVFITDEHFWVVIGKQRTGEERRKQHRREAGRRGREKDRGSATGDCAQGWYALCGLCEESGKSLERICRSWFSFTRSISYPFFNSPLFKTVECMHEDWKTRTVLKMVKFLYFFFQKNVEDSDIYVWLKNWSVKPANGSSKLMRWQNGIILSLHFKK